MKNRPFPRSLIRAAVILLLIVVGLPLFSRLYYGRSLPATLFAWQLNKQKYLSDYAFAELLNEKRMLNSPPYELPEDVAFSVPVEESTHAGVQCFVMNKGGDRTIFFFPGGSYIDQPRKVHWTFLDALARDTGAEIIVPIYPKLPDYTAETAYPILTAMYRSFRPASAFDEIIFMGDSAGGSLALSLAMQLRGSALPGPDKLILICPWLDVTLSNPEVPAYEKKDPALESLVLIHLGQHWAAALGTTDPIVSPLYGSFEDLGRITLITGTGELLYPDIRLMHEKLDAAGVDHDYLEQKGMFHVWPLYVGYRIPETQETYEDIAAAVMK